MHEESTNLKFWAESEVDHQASRVKLCSVLTELNKFQRPLFRRSRCKINLF